MKNWDFILIRKTLEIINEVLAEQRVQSCVLFEEAPDPDCIKQEMTEVSCLDTWHCLNAAESSLEPFSRAAPEFCLAARPLPWL